MADPISSTGPIPPRSVSDAAARQLANATKTVPQLAAITPRWLVHMLQWVPVEAGIYRLNRVREGSEIEVTCGERDERVLPRTYVDYDPSPRELFLSAVTTIVDDPKYLQQPFITSSHFKKEADASKWNPAPCSTDPPR